MKRVPRVHFSFVHFHSRSFPPRIKPRIKARTKPRINARTTRRERGGSQSFVPTQQKSYKNCGNKLRIFTHFGFSSLLFTPILCLLVLMPNCGLANARMPRERRAHDTRMRFRPQQIRSCPLQNGGNCLFFACLTDPDAIKHLFLWGLPQTPLVQS